MLLVPSGDGGGGRCEAAEDAARGSHAEGEVGDRRGTDTFCGWLGLFALTIRIWIQSPDHFSL